MSGTHSIKNVSMLVLLLLSVSSISPVVNQILLTGVSVNAAAWVPAAAIRMTTLVSDERVGFADHSDSLSSGNWIVLSGGTAVNLPTLQFQYQGVDDVQYTKAGKDVQITSNFTTRSVTYPLTTHQIYLPNTAITADFMGEGALALQNVEFRIVGGSVSDWKAAYTDLLTNADLTKLKNLIQAPVATNPVTAFDASGDAQANFPAGLPAGDYMLVALDESTVGPIYTLLIFGATPIEVIDYDTTAVHAASLEQGDNLAVSFTMTAPVSPTNYRYGAVMIRQAAYDMV